MAYHSAELTRPLYAHCSESNVLKVSEGFGSYGQARANLLAVDHTNPNAVQLKLRVLHRREATRLPSKYCRQLEAVYWPFPASMLNVPR
jgi:hypothetical protein